ncbi:MAG: tRNA pseudouridine(38-40) synthase TruA [Candidatus Obscuribacterales bacterium]|nr:tRNA pseudouridine(38-40) synthase TruA [Candidatus Obscuribacterales bacterium]
MQRIALKIEYCGQAFCGSQMQAHPGSVQHELETALATFFRVRDGKRFLTTFSGRTDAGVHATGQVAHFDLDDFLSQAIFNKLSFELNEEDLLRLCWSLNGILPSELSVTAAQPVSDKFHARFTALRRTYVYRILNRAQRSAIKQKTHYFVPSKLSYKVMKASAGQLLGSHDFSAFRSTNSDKGSSICHVDRVEILNLGEGELEFWISANHFVYNMIRIIVGTLIEVGLGKRPPSALSEALKGKDRNLAGPTAPPHGLCLHSVDYPAEFNLFVSGDLES